MLLHQDIKSTWKREASACQQELHQPSSQEYLTLAPRVSSQAWVWASHHAACLPHLTKTTRRFTLWSRFTGSISHQAARRMAPRLYVAIFRDGFQTILTSFGVKTTIAAWCAGQPWVKSRKLSLTLVLWGSSAPASMSRYRLHLWHVVHAHLQILTDCRLSWPVSWKWNMRCRNGLEEYILYGCALILYTNII